jgi:hypothetical protein
MRVQAAELGKWAHDLRLFEPELRPYMVGLAQPLHGFLLHARTHSGADGEPEGWNGLTQRGTVERLLHSEFALASMLPAEFLRRAAEQELLYWELGRQEPRQRGRLRLLLDTGPAMLGACRLVQMALLMVWSRLARERHCELWWACAQAYEENGRTAARELNAATLSTFLEARTLQPLGEVPRFAATGLPLDEDWIVTSEVRRGTARTLVVRQLDGEMVQVQLDNRSVNLRLPTDLRATSLLRGTVGSTRHADDALGGSVRGLQLTHVGVKLLTLAGDNLSIIPVPNSPRQPKGRVRSYFRPFTGRVVAVGAVRRVWMVLMEQDAGTWMMGRIVNADARDARTHVWQAPLSLGEHFGHLWEHGRDLWLWAAGRVLVLRAWEDGGAAKEWEMLLENQVGMLARGAGTLTVGTDGAVHALDGEPRLLMNPGQVGPVQRAFFSNVSGPSGLEYGCALQVGAGRWTVMSHGAVMRHDVEVRNGAVGGLVYPGPAWATPGLVVRNLNAVEILGDGFWQESVQFASAVEDVFISPVQPWMAYRLVDGEVGVYCFHYKDFLLRVRGK